VQFSTDEYVIGEGSKVIQVTVTRSGDASGTASVRYATWDQSQVGHASQKSDYTLNIGSLEFGAGQTSKSFSIRIINDKFDENDEDIDLALSNPSGAGLGLGSPAVAHVRITDNDTGAPSSNPLDGTAFFVRQQYLDFFGREPDASRLAYWSGIIDACGSNTTCRRNQRNSVSSQLLQSTESLDTSGTILRMSRAVFGKDPLYGDVAFFSQQLRSRGASAMATAFLAQPTAVVAVGSLGHTALVNKLTANSGYAFSTATKNGWISRLNAATLTRAGLLLELSKATGYVSSVRNRWVVLAGYWGYLRRDPDTAGFNTRLNQLIAGGGAPIASGLIDGFVRGAEYRQRFGPS
jgi:hypothetical protein